MFNVTQVYYWSRSDQYCTRIWDLFDECPCLSSIRSTSTDHHLVNVNALAYRQQVDSVAQYWQSLNLDSFAVTVQPFTENLKIINGVSLFFPSFNPEFLTKFSSGIDQ